MTKNLLTVALGVGLLAACSIEIKDIGQDRTYLITKENALSVVKLAFRTSAVVGRHAVVPPGSSGDPEKAPKCPEGDTEGTISIVPMITPDGAGNLKATVTETYDCDIVNGTITNSITSTLNTGLSFALETTNYTEGNDATGFVKYAGKLSVDTLADGTTTFKEDLAVTAGSAATASDTTLKTKSDVKVTTSETQLQFDGSIDLNITGTGEAKVVMTGVDFKDCKTGPATGKMELALIGLEKAELRFSECGKATLVHFNGDSEGTIEVLTSAEVEDTFGLAVSDVTNFKNVAINAAPSITGTLSVEAKFCAPIFGNTTASTLASSFAPSYAAALDLSAVAHPVVECLQFPTPGTLATGFAHLVLADETNTGTFADPTKVQVLYYRAGIFTENTGTPSSLLYVKELTTAGATTYQSTLDPLGEDLTATCAPGGIGGPACTQAFSFTPVADHMGIFMVADPVTDSHWFAFTIPAAQ